MSKHDIEKLGLDGGVNASIAPEVIAEKDDANAPVNASGHVQELERNFGLLSLAGLGLTAGNVWPAIGGSILVAIFNGGPPGVLYEFLVVSFFYWNVAASIAELSSAIPSSAGVYHWASVTPGLKRGRAVGFFAGWWNYLGLVTGVSSMTSIFSTTLVQMYAINHPDLVVQNWHVFVTYALSTILACALICYSNRIVPLLNHAGLFAIIAGFFVTIIVVAVMPGRGGRAPHASSAFVWSEWVADIGYPNGFVFVSGMLNGAFSVGAVDVVTHLAEEIPNPQRNIPLALLIQYGIGFITGFAYLIAIMYAISDYKALFESSYPIAEIYRQATGTAAGATGLMSLVMICIGFAVVGNYTCIGRTLWALSRDGATPFPQFLSHVDEKLHMPFRATIVSASLSIILGLIYVGSATAFNALVGSYVLTSTSSYLAAILPNLLTGRKNIKYGTFHMRGWIGVVVNTIACVYMVVWFVIYSFPTALPTDAQAMNYSSLIWGAFTIFFALWWFISARKNYQGPGVIGGLDISLVTQEK